MSRFLTPAEKSTILRLWDAAKEDFADQVAAGTLRARGDLGGQGFPDPAVYDFCDALNAIDGICTVQSCSGHRVEIEGYKDPTCWKGQVWIRLDRTMRDLFIQHSGRLFRCRGIEIVALRLGHFGGDTADIIFDGLDIEGSGEEQLLALRRSENRILRFFQQIRAEADANS